MIQKYLVLSAIMMTMLFLAKKVDFIFLWFYPKFLLVLTCCDNKSWTKKKVFILEYT